MITQILATKREMRQAWTKSGKRIPVTVAKANDCVAICPTTTQDTFLFGQGKKKLKNVSKPQQSQLKKAGLSFGVRVFKQVHVNSEDAAVLKAGTVIVPSSVLKAGDRVKVSGHSKGRGFSGNVKRHSFSGGPRTHGQSDRERAPGSIGAGTTPGRVYRNKRMAGRFGGEKVTTVGLTVLSVSDATGEVLLKGCIPGAINSSIMITKIGEDKKFDGLLEKQKSEEQPTESKAQEEALEPAKEPKQTEEVAKEESAK